MIRQTEDEIRSISSEYDDCEIIATRIGSKWIVDLLITDYVIIRMRSVRNKDRLFGSLDAVIKACDGMADKLIINI